MSNNEEVAVANMSKFLTKTRALAKVLKAGDSTVKDLQKEHESLPPNVRKLSSEKINAIKAIHCVVDGVLQTFISVHGVFQSKVDLEADDINKLREMMDTMDAFSKALQTLYGKPYLSFERLKELVSWVTKNPKSFVGGAGAFAGVAGVVGYGATHGGMVAAGAAGLAAAGPAALAGLASFGVGLLVGLLALGVIHLMTKDEEAAEETHRRRLEAMIKKIKEDDVLSVDKIVQLREDFQTVVEEASTPPLPESEAGPIPPHDACLICLKQFERVDRRSVRLKPTAAEGCVHHFCHAKCYTEWRRTSKKKGCLVCHNNP